MLATTQISCGSSKDAIGAARSFIPTMTCCSQWTRSCATCREAILAIGDATTLGTRLPHRIIIAKVLAVLALSGCVTLPKGEHEFAEVVQSWELLSLEAPTAQGQLTAEASTPHAIRRNVTRQTSVTSSYTTRHEVIRSRHPTKVCTARNPQILVLGSEHADSLFASGQGSNSAFYERRKRVVQTIPYAPIRGARVRPKNRRCATQSMAPLAMPSYRICDGIASCLMIISRAAIC
jgi:hypothetical protein